MRWVLTQHCSWLQANTAFIRKNFSVILERTVRELNGESCISLEETPPAKQQIVCSRSFGERITDKDAMHQAVVQYAERAAEKLRGERQYCRQVTTFTDIPLCSKRTLLQQCYCGKAFIAHTGQPGHYCRRMQSLKPCLA